MSKFEKNIGHLAENIFEAVKKETIPIDQKIDAFKALTAYYSLLLKSRKIDEKEATDPNEFRFDTAFDQLEPTKIIRKTANG